MSRCADYFRNVQNGRRCHVNGKNAKKIEKHKNDHSRLLAEEKLMKLDRNNIHIQWNEISQKNRNRLDKLCRSCHGNKKEGFKKNWIPFMKLCRNIHSSVWQLLGVLKKNQNGGRCHGNQGTKWPPNTKIFRFGLNLVSKQIMMLRIDSHRWFAMAAILNSKWPPKYKNPLIWAKFGFQVDFDVGN